MFSKSTPILGNCKDCTPSAAVTRCTSAESLRVLAVFSIPGRFEAATGFLEGRVGLGGASTRRVKRLRQLGNLGRPTRVQAVLDRPGIAAGLGDQRPDVYVAQLHTTAFNSAALPSSMSVNPVAAWRAFSPTVINACR